ncbi:DUF1488 domain-containing protein [Shewanella sp. 10N.286.48.A6]|uniref:DUF1488 domain-containing protein n=1 Tax=Shewanella sp. 10N.286.48.A6 TaxID=1880833 RepID=UPI000C8226FE|nr:DUF1488 domain-containing protein [Shewanella sp. 10N.286.48.A6]PMH96268.1 hypothetical protein BCU55_19505 [Shewanella sp. 10N.286.48.A6]
MNQSVIFTDLVEWNTQQQTMLFSAQVQGMNINCIVSKEKLLQLISSEQTAAEQPMLAEQALAIFERVRFDLEDIAEEMIEAEEFDPQGNITI